MTEEAKTAEQRRGPGRPRKPVEEPHAIVDGVLGLDPAFRPALDLDELASQLSETVPTEVAALSSPDEPETDVVVLPPSEGIDWNPMDTARRDGRPIWLTDGNGKTVEAVWRHSKQFTMKADATGRLVSRWYTHNFWAINNAGGQKVPWEPKGWRAIFA